MITDNAHAATLQARHEGPCIDVGTFTTDAWGRAFAAAVGALAAIGADIAPTERVDFDEYIERLEEQLALHINAVNTTLPEDEDAVEAEAAEARRVAGLLIEQYKRQPASAATYLATRFAPSQPVNRGVRV